MRQDQRQRIGFGGADVQEVDGETVDRRAELTPPVQLSLDFPPVVVIAPVVRERLEFPEGGPLTAVGDCHAFRPADGAQPVLEVGELRVGDGEGDGFDIL